MNRPVVAVLFGGQSPEYAVSLRSAATVLRSIDTQRYEVIAIGITREGTWYRYTGAIARIPEDDWQGQEHCHPAMILPDRSLHGMAVWGPYGVEKLRVDAAMPVLHGENGEDGTVQGLLELAGIPIAGCGSSASAVCMDKAFTHAIAAQAGVCVPDGAVVYASASEASWASQAQRVGYPLFVKPARAGSSFGVSCVKQPQELSAALINAFKYGSKAVLEERIVGFEVGCAIVGTKEPVIGLVDEVELKSDFFDYREKYGAGSAQVHVPARVEPAVAERIRQTGLAAYQAMGCSGFARVDLFYTQDGRIVLNEINTIPGLTEHSRFPRMISGIGLTLSGFIELLLEETIHGGTSKRVSGFGQP